MYHFKMLQVLLNKKKSEINFAGQNLLSFPSICNVYFYAPYTCKTFFFYMKI